MVNVITNARSQLDHNNWLSLYIRQKIVSKFFLNLFSGSSFCAIIEDVVVETSQIELARDGKKCFTFEEKGKHFVTDILIGQFHQTWAHSVNRKSAEVQQHNKLVNFFSTDNLTVFLCFWYLRKHLDEIDPWSEKKDKKTFW